ncbi:hypothetical protein JCM5176_08650 [Streptococcus sobrinus]
MQEKILKLQTLSVEDFEEINEVDGKRRVLSTVSIGCAGSCVRSTISVYRC